MFPIRCNLDHVLYARTFSHTYIHTRMRLNREDPLYLAYAQVRTKPRGLYSLAYPSGEPLPRVLLSRRGGQTLVVDTGLDTSRGPKRGRHHSGVRLRLNPYLFLPGRGTSSKSVIAAELRVCPLQMPAKPWLINKPN